MIVSHATLLGIVTLVPPDLAMDQTLAMGPITLAPTTASVYTRVTLEIPLTASYTNPFDSRQIAVDVTVTPPSGRAWTVPGFLYQPFERALEGETERLTPAGPPRWQARLAAVEPGPHEVVVTATDRTGTVRSESLRFTATAADAPGYARRAAADHRYFVTDRGETLFLIGANVCWGGRRGSYDYDNWLPKYAEQGANFFRAWLSPMWTTFALNTNDSGYDAIALANAWRLDHVLELSERLDLRMMFCIDSFNILRPKADLYGQWEDSPYIRAHGGPLDEPRRYFTDETMLAAYRDRLRYLVARWGYSPAVFAWEFWNEVDIVGQYDSDTVAEWHRRMATHLRAIDPWKHLITTSYARTAGDPKVDGLPELDFVQSHHYGPRDMAVDLLRDRETKAAATDRPHFTGEFGIGHDGRRTAETDPTGIHLHNGLFASPGQLQAGTPMTWWWDSYVEPCNLYPIFGAFRRFIDGFDFVAERARAAVATVTYADPDAPRPAEDWEQIPTAASWQPADYNRPVTITIRRDGTVEQTAPLSRVLHGTHNHPTLHNPATFVLDVPAPTRFVVEVGGVSGYGGAALQIALDGQVVLDKAFPDEDEGHDTLNQYDGEYAIDLPAGAHTVVVENLGSDWLYVAYRIPRLLQPAGPPARVLGVIGERRALLWVQSRLYTWYHATRPGFEPQTIRDLVVTVTGLTPGRWTVERFDTHEGRVTGVEERTVAADGELRLALAELTWDAGWRLARQGD